MAAYTRKQYSGAARNTTTTTLLTNVGTTVDIAATTGWPSIAGIPFYVVISPSSIYEEKCLATISGSTLTLDRAKDDTTASEHQIGSVIYPVFTANDADEANELVSKLTTTGDLLTTDGTNLLRLGVGEDGYFLKASSSASAGIEWASIPTINSLDDVGDVTITTVEDGDFLTYNSSASAWVNETIHFITVSDTEPADEVSEGDLWYNSSELELYTYYSGAWVQVTLTADFLTVEELDNVYIDNANAGDVLAFDGLDWYNANVDDLLTTASVSFQDVSSETYTGNIVSSVHNTYTLGTNETRWADIFLGPGTLNITDNVTGANAGLTVADGVLQIDGANQLQVGQLKFVDNNIESTSASINIEIGELASTGNITLQRDVVLGTGRSLTFPDSTEQTTAWTGIQANSVALGTDTTGNYVSNVSGGTGISVSHTPGEGSSASISLNATIDNLSDVVIGAVYSVGNTGPAGGVIFMTPNTSGNTTGKYFEASPASAEAERTWASPSNTNTFVSGADGTAIGAGAQNTIDIVAQSGNVAGTCAAVYASEYSYGGYSDWFLPSRDEIVKLYLSKALVGGLENALYHSSTEGDSNAAVYLYASVAPGIDGTTESLNKGSGPVYARPVRSFDQPTASSGDLIKYNGTNWVNDSNALTASSLQTARTIALSGDVSGSVSFNGSASVSIATTIQPNSVALGTDTTGNYMSDLNQGTGVTITHTPGEGSNATIAIGQAVATSSSVSFARVETTGDVVVGGNLTVNGTTTTLNTETLLVEDNIVVLNSGITASPTLNSGIEVERGTSDNVSIRWNESTDKWEITNDGSTYGDIATETYVVDLTSTLDNIGDVSLTPPYSIGDTGPAGGKIFITPDTAGNSTGMYFEAAPTASQVQRSWATGGNQSSAVPGAAGTAIGTGAQNTVDIVAQSGNLAATSAARYASDYEYNNFSDWFLPSIDELQELYDNKTSVGGLLSSNYWSSTEYSATQAEYENLGDGGQAFAGKNLALYVRPVRAFLLNAGEFLKYDGSSWVNDTINLGTDTTGNYMSDLTQGTGVTITHTPGEGSNATIAIGQAVATSSSVTFAAVTAPVIGNASTATTLQTARAITLGGDLSGSASFNGASDITINASVINSGVSLDEISDVVITTPLTHQSITYNGTSWVNEYAPTVTYARNVEANALSVGEVVYLFGATGDRASVKRASNSSEATSSKTVGVVSVGGAAGADVTVTTLGYVSGVSLGSYAAGDVLWLDSTSGGFTKTKPSAPAHLVFIGVVAKANAGNGIMYVKCQNGYEINELHDVAISASVAAGDFLKYDGTVWVNDPINLGTDTVGNYMLNVSAGTGIAISHTQGEGSTASVSTTGVQTLGAKAGNYTLAIGDAAETIIIMDSSSANDLTVPSASAVAFGTGTSITVVQRGTGKTRILAGAGVTLLATPGVYLRARYSSCTLVKTENANEWFVIGDLAAS